MSGPLRRPKLLRGMNRLLAAALLCALPARAGVQIWIAGESEKVRPAAALPARAPARIVLSAAGGECAAARERLAARIEALWHSRVTRLR